MTREVQSAGATRRAVVPAILVAVVLIVGGGGYLLIARQGESGSADAGNPGLVALGREVYLRACASCHGAGLEGQPDWRTRLPNGRLPAPPHDETGHTWHHPDPQLFEMTKFGVVAFAPAGYESDMPAFEQRLTDREIWAVLSYIKSTWPEQIRSRHDQINARAGG